MYEKVMPPREHRRDRMLITWIVLAAVFFTVVLIPIVGAARYQRSFQKFVLELTEDIRFARRNASAQSLGEGGIMEVSEDAMERLFSFLVDAGPGKPQKEPPDSELVTLYFGNGASISFRYTEITEETRRNDDGTYVAYTSADGREYVYDNDLLPFESIYALLRKR